MLVMHKTGQAVSGVIGLLIGLAIFASILLYFQVTVVPQVSEQSEVNTRFKVFNDMSSLTNDISRAESTDRTVQSTVRRDVDYPSFIRGFQTEPRFNYVTENGGASIRNANKSDSEFFESTTNWDSDVFYIDIIQSQSTESGNEVGFEYGAPYNNLDSGFLVKNTVLVDDTNISVYLLDAELGEQSSDTDDVWFVSSSGFDTTETTDDGSNIRMTLETRVSESAWNEALQDELKSNGGHIDSIEYSSNDNSLNEVTLVFEKGLTYEFTVGRAEVTSY